MSPRKIPRTAGIIVCMAISCVSISTTDASPVSFAKNIVPILEARCASCHMTGDEPGEMALIADAAYPSLLRQSSQIESLKIVQPGSPGQSYLMLKLEGTHLEVEGQGARMPLAAPPLSQDQLKLIRDWIEQGARAN